jgi:hypothetical protein
MASGHLLVKGSKLYVRILVDGAADNAKQLIHVQRANEPATLLIA